jgi:hypothetical protein
LGLPKIIPYYPDLCPIPSTYINHVTHVGLSLGNFAALLALSTTLVCWPTTAPTAAHDSYVLPENIFGWLADNFSWWFVGG